ncbi:uncharacterized protein C8orf48 homolog isoform X1 [Pezoporus occidentalis]|uniref:uncharacterized protein C8orf48 homolog isoform X1 n=1 Tax=Pezoporus occidentalis TaxID=407982 RepID=UPI002F914CA6
MLTAPADSSGDYKKQQMELSQSHSSSGLHYSEDTFESFSEEEEAHWQRESDPPESCCSTEDLEGSAVSDEQPEVADSAAAERDLVGRWIGLITKKSDIKQDRSVIKTHAEMSELSDEELDALRSFCTKKISGMHQQLISKQTNGDKSRKLQLGLTAKKPDTNDLSCVVPDGLMNRIRLKNIGETVKQVTETRIHDPSVCPDCQEKEAELAKITFCRRKKVLMESALIQEKLEEQIYLRDTFTLLGEALRSLPKPSEDPRNLRQRLKGLTDILVGLPLGSHFQVLAFSSAKGVALVMTKFLQTPGKSRALLAPLISSRGICSGITFLPSFPSLFYAWYFLPFILSHYSSMVSLLGLVDRFLLKLFSTRSCSPNPFTEHPLTQDFQQALRHSRPPCAVGVSLSHWPW